jgi:hypothetical protein
MAPSRSRRATAKTKTTSGERLVARQETASESAPGSRGRAWTRCASTTTASPTSVARSRST